MWQPFTCVVAMVSSGSVHPPPDAWSRAARLAASSKLNNRALFILAEHCKGLPRHEATVVRSPSCSTRHAVGRTRDVVDLPDLPGEGDDIRGIPDELERGRPVQTVHDDGEGAVRVDLHERAGVRYRPVMR
jgi:hypothetical protein